MPIAYVLSVTPYVLLYSSGEEPMAVSLAMSNGISSFILLAVPFFILAGNVMTDGGLTKPLADWVTAMVGRMRGGLLQALVIAMYIFSGISGSKIADVAAVGTTLKSMLKDQGYDPAESGAILAAAGIMGETIPPSLVMMVLASITTLSVATFFVAGVVPAAVLGLCLMLMSNRRAKKYDWPRHPAISWSERARLSVHALPALMVPMILIIGIVGGFATTTEVSSIAMVFSIVVSVFICRGMNFKSFITMKPLFHLLSTAALSALLCCANSITLAQSKFVLKLAHSDSVDIATSRKAVMAETFTREVKARSDGRITVQIFGAGAPGGERELIESVKNGFIQAGLVSGVMANFFPSAMVTDIPHLFPNSEVADKVMDGPFGQKLSKDLTAATGMHNMCFGEVGFRHSSSGKKPIHSPKDLVGMKIRVRETPVYVTEMKALGAQPTPIAFPETHTALQTGVVDDQENPIPTLIFAKLYEVQKHVTLDGRNYGVDWFVVGDKLYKSPPPDLLKVVSDAAMMACD